MHEPADRLPTTLLRLLPLLPICALTACGGGARRPVASYSTPSYAPPGPPSDPWGPYISEASRRFNVPPSWIRAVMHQESGGHEYMRGQPITSDAGATGLMQVMPATYAELATRFNLGPDPYQPHDNIVAGTGYIKDLYDRYGSPNFLAAYNAGPHRLDAYLAGQGALPNETVNYVASIAPSLSGDRPLTGPLAVYADSGPIPRAEDPVPRAYAAAPSSRCWQDPDAAYDPDAPCRTAPPVRVAAVVSVAPPMASPPVAAPPLAAPPLAAPVAMSGWGRGEPVSRQAPASSAQCWRDPDAAYDPTAPCRPPPPAPLPAPTAQIAAQTPAAPAAHETQLAAAQPGPDWQRLLAVHDSRPIPAAHTVSAYVSPVSAAATVRPAMATGRWGIQIGAYASPGQARRMAESVRSLAPRELGGAQATLGATAPFGGQVMYRARLIGLSARSASAACGELTAQSQACVTVPPGG